MSVPRCIAGGLAFAFVLVATTLGATHGSTSAAGAQPDAGAGRALYVEGCSSCHGLDARGIRGQGPSLIGAGAQAADFYLSTGRMPLDHPGDEPMRAAPAYGAAGRAALTAYVGSLGGPKVPRVDITGASLSAGRAAFTLNCAGCHQVDGRGGVGPEFVAPELQRAAPRQVVEAMRVGPYTMPVFSRRQIDDATAAAIARYVVSTRHLDDRGGWGLGNIGPIPEGLVAWLVATVVLLGLARVVGERTA
jgi:ubiquinol-cytochrome c reductase cytochrome c subunit